MFPLEDNAMSGRFKVETPTFALPYHLKCSPSGLYGNKKLLHPQIYSHRYATIYAVLL